MTVILSTLGQTEVKVKRVKQLLKNPNLAKVKKLFTRMLNLRKDQ